jgi:PAS domain-containing protein
MSKTNIKIRNISFDSDFVVNYWDTSWTYIKTVVDVVHDPILILDKDFRVLSANESFYEKFKTNRKDTEGQIVYELGNEQWNIPELRKLLEDILPKKTFFKGFEVTHIFPQIGRRVMILNSRQIFVQNKSISHEDIILLAMDDITEMVDVAEMLARHTKEVEL